MRRAGWLSVIVFAALAGCLGPADAKDVFEARTIVAVLPSDVEPANRSAEQFYLILVSGVETTKRVKGGPGLIVPCDRPWLFEADRAAGTLRYDAHRVRIDPFHTQVVVAVDYRADPMGGHGGCGVQRLDAFPGRAKYETWVRGDLRAELVVEAQNGMLAYDKAYFVPMGKKIHVNLQRVTDYPDATFHVTGDYEVVNLGLWPLAGLQPMGA